MLVSLQMLLAAGLAAARPVHVAAGAQKGPKAILTIIIDDMGWFDSQPHNPAAPTPTLGRLAADGILLERQYAYVFCSPSRRSFVTGRFPVHIVGVQADVCSNWTPLGMTLLAGKLAQAGFQSHFIGKTNVGFQTTDHMPVNRNFTSHVGFLYGAEDYAYGGKPLYRGEEVDAQLELARVQGFGTSSAQLRSPGPHCVPYVDAECMAEGDMKAHHTSKYFGIDFWEGQLPAPELAKTVYYSTNFYTERALALLRNFSAAAAAGPQTAAATSAAEVLEDYYSAQEKIWVHLCYQAVHGPFTDVPEWEALSPPFLRGGSKIYGDMLAVMDRGIANITDELRRSGLYEDTLIITVSDNGGPTSTTGPNNYPLRGSKESPWEGGTRVASFISGGFLPPAVRGTVSHSFIHIADWYATLCVLVGVDPSDVYKGHDVDSIDVWPMITGANLTNPREYLPVTEQSLIWQGQYKYFFSSDSPFGFNGWSERNNSMVPVKEGVAPTCTNCLFDLLADPTEMRDISGEHPGIVAQLAAQLKTYRYYTNASMTAQELQGYDCASVPSDPEFHGDWPMNWPWTTAAAQPALPTSPPVPPQPAVFDPTKKGPLVSITAAGKQAAWTAGVASCNQVALLLRNHHNDARDNSSDSVNISQQGGAASSSSGSGDSFWLQLGGGKRASFLDVGWCDPRIALNLSGSAAVDWMGDQADPVTGRPYAWIYRQDGKFRAANATHAQGVTYGRPIAASTQNITVIRHSPTHLEFLLDGVSQGRVDLRAAQALPPNAVGCVGMCNTEKGRGRPPVVSLASLNTSAAGQRIAIAGPCCRRKPAADRAGHKNNRDP